jgi:hypothetical protein
MMVNLGTEEGVTVTEGRFSTLWPRVKQFVTLMRAKGCLMGTSIDPLTGHECGNQRYLAIVWFDECLAARLPTNAGEPLRPMPAEPAWLAALSGSQAYPAAQFQGDKSGANWLPNERIAKAWMQYVSDTLVTDETPPPAPANVTMTDGLLTWNASADPESGIQHFTIWRNGTQIATVSGGKNPYGRPVFQGLQYSDTPLPPLVDMQFMDPQWTPDRDDEYLVATVNTVGLSSKRTRSTTERMP